MYKESHEKTCYRKPIELIQLTNPVVIIDEPQSVDSTDNAKTAIQNLSPAMVLKYSATHRESVNLLYKLDPVDAYNDRLVKKIEVLPVVASAHNDPVVRLLEVRTKGSKIEARLEFYKNMAGGKIKLVKKWFKPGESLYEASGRYYLYADDRGKECGNVVGDCHVVDVNDMRKGVTFANGKSTTWELD